MSAGIAASAAETGIERQSFPGADRGVYLNTAAEGLFLSSHSAALARYAECKELGYAGRAECAATEEACRVLAAGMLGARPHDIAFVASTARGLDAVIKSIGWRPGDNVVLADSEFPTTAFAATLLAECGVERRVVPARGGETPVADFAARIDSRTRLVLASLVSFKTGYLIDVPALAVAAHDTGALLFVDAIQAFGAVPVDCRPADFLCAGTFKWLLGSHGLAVLYTSPDVLGQLKTPYVGYRSVVDIFPAEGMGAYELHADARRFEEGMPNYPAMFVLENALRFLESVGLDRVAAHNAELMAAVMSGLEKLGLTPLTTSDPLARAGIVSVETPLAVQVASRLAESGIHIWGKDGRIRISPHLYNTLDDIGQLMAALGELVRSGMALQPRPAI